MSPINEMFNRSHGIIKKLLFLVVLGTLFMSSAQANW